MKYRIRRVYIEGYGWLWGIFRRDGWMLNATEDFGRLKFIKPFGRA